MLTHCACVVPRQMSSTRRLPPCILNLTKAAQTSPPTEPGKLWLCVPAPSIRASHLRDELCEEFQAGSHEKNPVFSDAELMQMLAHWLEMRSAPGVRVSVDASVDDNDLMVIEHSFGAECGDMRAPTEKDAYDLLDELRAHFAEPGVDSGLLIHVEYK